MGQFLFTPKAGDTYKAICIWKDGTITKYSLPAAFNGGYVVRLSEEGGHVNFQVSSSAERGDETIYLLVHTRQKLKFARFGLLQKGKMNFIVNKDSLAEGISHF